MTESTALRPTFGSAIACRDPMAAVAWLEKAFGFETSLLITDTDGNLAHSEMTFGNGYVMVGSEWTDNVRAPSSIGGANTQSISVSVERDVDAHCEQARAAGARIIMEPADEPYGARVYVAVDPEGHVWDFSEPREAAAEAMDDAGYAVQQLAQPTEEQSATTFFPNAFYQDARAAQQWLAAAFGFEQQLLIEGQDGHIRGHLGFDGGRVAVSSQGTLLEQVSRSSPRSAGSANTQTIHVQLRQGIDEHCRRAKAGGAVILQEPEDQFYGDRTYRAVDLEGHIWTFGQTLRVTTPEEWEAATGLKTRTSL